MRLFEFEGADDELFHTLVGPAALDALQQAAARSRSYSVRAYVGNDPRPRIVVVLGEAHLKLEHASVLGKDVISQFELRGVETFQKKEVLFGRLLGPLIHGPRVLLRRLSLGLVKDSSIRDALDRESGVTDRLERDHSVPKALHAASVYLTLFFAIAFASFGTNLLALVLSAAWLRNTQAILGTLLFVFQLHLLLVIPAVLFRRRSWAWLIHPALGLVTTRDVILSDGTQRMLIENSGPDAALVILGRAHQPGFGHELIARFGFRRIL